MKSSSTNHQRSVGIFTVGLLLVAMAFPLAASAADKVVLCHNGHTIEVSINAVYGRGGHLQNDGTPQGGHEGDHLGECLVAPSSTTTALESTTTTITVPDESTTTTAQESTTTTEQESTTTTAQESTTTTENETTTTEQETTTTTLGLEVGASGETTTTTDPKSDGFGPDPTTEVEGVVESTTGPQPSTPMGPQTGDVVVDSLPFTGLNLYLVVPGVVLMLIGLVAVLLGGGLGSLRRGRYEAR